MSRASYLEYLEDLLKFENIRSMICEILNHLRVYSPLLAA